MSAELPLERFYDLTQVTGLSVSPDGEAVAFTAAEFDPDEEERVASLFVAPTDGSEEPHRLTRRPGASDPRWSPDGDRLGFLAAREEDVERRVGYAGEDGEDDGDEGGDGENGDDGADGDGENGDDETDGDESEDGTAGNDEEPKNQLWYFDLRRGGDARQVTDREEGVSAFDWGPDGDRVVVAARDPTDEEREYLDERRDGGPIEVERLQHKLDGVGWLDSVTTYLFVVDVGTGEERRLDDAYDGGAFARYADLEPAWGPDGRIAFTSCRTERPDDTFVRDLYTIAPDGSDLRKLTDSDLSVHAPRWSPDGERLSFGGREPDNWCIPTQVYVHDGDGYGSATADLDRTLAWTAAPEWTSAGTIHATVADEARSRLVRIDLDGADGSVGEATVERTFEAQGDDRALEFFDAGGGAAAFALSHPGEGQDVWAVGEGDLSAAVPSEADSLARLSGLNDDLVSEFPMPMARRIDFESGGRDVEAVAYAPPTFDFEDPEPRPLVLAIHGGPISYDEPVFDFTHAALTSRGYLVLRVNYRGGTSYGREFAEELWGRWGTVEVDDLVAGVEDVAGRGWADPDRVFGYGFSYGGIAQGYLVTQTDLLTAAAPEHGIYDLRSAYGTDDSHVHWQSEFGVPWENSEAYEADSSIPDADDLDTPLLVMAGGEDWRCAPSQSEQLYVAAKKRGVDAKLVVYPDEHHSITDPDRAIHRLGEILDWYATHDPARDEDGDPSADTGCPGGERADESGDGRSAGVDE